MAQAELGQGSEGEEVLSAAELHFNTRKGNGWSEWDEVEGSNGRGVVW